MWFFLLCILTKSRLCIFVRIVWLEFHAEITNFSSTLSIGFTLALACNGCARAARFVTKFRNSMKNFHLIFSLSLSLPIFSSLQHNSRTPHSIQLIESHSYLKANRKKNTRNIFLMSSFFSSSSTVPLLFRTNIEFKFPFALYLYLFTIKP